MLPWIEANNDKCWFCHGADPGYSLDDDKGVERAACWACAKKEAKRKEEQNGPTNQKVAQ
jgi:hypothetical protein